MSILANHLAHQGLPTVSLDDGKILVSEFAGRVLALCPDGETNLFWINPEFPQKLGDWRNGREWSNLGGERAWIAPELDTNVPDPANFADSYAVQPALDPGDHQLTQRNGTLTLRNRARARWLRADAEIDLETERHIRSLESPLFLANLTGNLAFAGYEIEACLHVHERPADARPALWNLIQLPGGGIAKAVVKGGGLPVSVIGNAIWEHKGSVIQSAFPVNAAFKWSLHASESAGRIAYRRPLENGRTGLVVRDFPLAADSDYPDCPAHDPADTGHACQIYLDDGGLGGFAELEFHCPAVPADETSSTTISCQTYGWIGTSSEIDALETALNLAN